MTSELEGWWASLNAEAEPRREPRTPPPNPAQKPGLPNTASWIIQAQDAMRAALEGGMVGTGPGYGTFEPPTVSGKVVGSPPVPNSRIIPRRMTSTPPFRSPGNPYKVGTKPHDRWDADNAALGGEAPTGNIGPKAAGDMILKAIKSMAPHEQRESAGIWLTFLTSVLSEFVKSLDEPDEDEE